MAYVKYVDKKKNGHKCDLDIIRKNKISIDSNSFLTWNEQYKNVVENINKKTKLFYY